MFCVAEQPFSWSWRLHVFMSGHTQRILDVGVQLKWVFTGSLSNWFTTKKNITNISYAIYVTSDFQQGENTEENPRVH